MKEVGMKVITEESGQAVVVAAVFMGLVALGFVALALDVGYLFREKHMAQSAADAVAVAAAEEVASGNSGNEQTVANAVAKLNGFDTTLAKNPAVVTFPTPGGNFSGSGYVAVTVSKPIPTFFMGAFSSRFSTTTISATATAGGGQLSQTCVCIEGGSGTTLNMSNNNQLIANGCGVVVNSSSNNAVEVAGSASITASSLGLSSSTGWNSSNITGSSGWDASEMNNGGSVTVNGIKNTESTTTISGAVPGVNSCAPAMPSAPTYDSTRCAPDPGGGSSVSSFVPAPYAATGSNMGGCYSGLTVGANGTTGSLASGIYVVTGQLHFTGTSSGYGVFFYLTSTGSLSIDNWASPNLVAGDTTEAGGGTAPSLGTSYNGILFYQTSSNTIQIQGGSNAALRGAIYAPSATVNVGNGSAATVPIGGLVANSLVMGTSGGAVLNVSNDTDEGSVSMGSPKLVQ